MSLGSHLRLLRAAVFAVVCLVLSAIGHMMMSGQGIPLWALLVGFAGVFAVAMGLTRSECSYVGIASAVLASELVLHFFFSAAQDTVRAAPVATAAVAALWASALLCVPGRPGASLPQGTTLQGLLRAAGLDPALAAHAPATAAATMSMSMSPTSSMPMPMGSQPMAGMSALSAPMHMGAMGLLGHQAWAMLAAHLVAGLLSAWWLRRGEAAAFVLLRTMGALAVGCLLRLALLLLGIPGGTWTPPAALRRLDATRLLPQTGRRALLHLVIRRGPPLCPLVG